MNSSASTEKSVITSTFEVEYRSTFYHFVSQPDETVLGDAYELGRKALKEGRSLMEIASIHQEALQELVFSENANDGFRERALRVSAQFLLESLSPYEMAHRGFQDAVNALRQMNDRLEEQIKGIAYAVHDEAGQLLVAVHLALASLANDVPEPQQKEILKIEGLLNEVEKQLRQYSHELRPTILDDLGWLPALRFLADGVSKRANIPVHVEATFNGRLPSPVETAIYRVVQEALNNAIKHSAAKNVWISAEKKDDALCCSVRDDGVGFDLQALRAPGRRKGLGLTGMQERLNAVAATLRVETAPGKGTELQIKCPLENLDANPSGSRR